MSGIKKLAQNGLLIILSLTVMVLLGESLLRFILEPVDFLRPELIKDEYLGYIIKPSSSNHDEWGFRNKAVPEQVDILAIGDSQTYGVSATSYNSWPAWLARKSSKSVYNMSLGGYGPVQYKYLYEKYGVRLKPKRVIVGLYFGNDFFDVKNMVVGSKQWQYLGKNYPSLISNNNELPSVNFNDVDLRALSGARDWLSMHSMFYRVLYFALDSTVLPLIHTWELNKKINSKKHGNMKILKYGDGRVTGVRSSRIIGLNTKNQQIMDAFKLSLTLLRNLKDLCEANGASFSVLLIPTKELVFSPFYSDDKDDIHEVLAYEKQLRKKAVLFLKRHKIDYIDVLPSLQGALPNEQIYPISDGHPNKNGYEIIANSIMVHFKENN